ncbi:MAG: ECF transporter S component [Candidatus Bathyarchaeota archaeon]|nr:ECF transporter S component [Candidatus Bathyarchaeota archaeon]
MSEQKKLSATLQLAAAAVFASLVFVATYSFTVNIPSTSGYFNLGESIIYVAALLFGPLTGALSGGIGAMTADMLLGYGHFAPGTLGIKLIEGAIVGFLYKKLRSHIQNRSVCAVIATVAGGLEMVAGYFVYEVVVLGYPVAVAAVEVPFSLVQMTVGLIIAIPIVHTVTKVFPQLKN